MLLCREGDAESPSQQILYSLLTPDKADSTYRYLYPQQQGVVQHHKASGPPSSPPHVEALMSPTQTAVTCANAMSNTNSPLNINPALKDIFLLAPSPATGLQAALHHRVTGASPRWCPGENGTKTIPAQYVQAGLGHWETGLLHGLSQTHLPCPRALQTPVRILGRTKSLWAGYKKRIQEGCEEAAAMCPSKSLLEMQKREEAESSHFPRKGNLRGPILPSRICPGNRRLKQRRCTRCILLLSLAEDGLEAMELQAGEVSSAQLPVPCCCCSPLLIYPSSPWLSLSFGGWEVVKRITTGWILIFEQFPSVPAAVSLQPTVLWSTANTLLSSLTALRP